MDSRLGDASRIVDVMDVQVTDHMDADERRDAYMEAQTQALISIGTSLELIARILEKR